MWRTAKFSCSRKLFYKDSYLRCSTLAAVSCYTQRSHSCGELSAANIGASVTLCGWIHFSRLQGRFLILRDSYGLTQVMVSSQKLDLVSLVRSINLESVIQVKGKVQQRPAGQENAAMSTGAIEVDAEDIKVLNLCMPQLAMPVNTSQDISDHVRLRYRYLDLRRDVVQKALRLRAQVVDKMRRFLIDQLGFLEVETPTLFRRTPGGAAEFVVPSSSHPGHFYCLPQSPQQFKQLLMVGGIDRYFQVARCYRDEGSRSDRQVEFTQVDIEASFVSQANVMSIIEQLIHNSWPTTLSSHQLPTVPFPRMTYETAMETYGSDKPDTRYAWTLQETPEKETAKFSHLPNLKWIIVSDGAKLLSEEERIDQINALNTSPFAATVRMLDGRMISHECAAVAEELRDAVKACAIEASDSDLIIFAFDHCRLNVLKSLGLLRTRIIEHIECKSDTKLRPNVLNFLWIVDFPLFVRKEEVSSDDSSQLESAHHPFTAPIPEHADLIWSEPQNVTGQHYDLVLNGVELGGGSIRIHDAKLQRYVLDSILKEDSSTMAHLLEALDSGAPPHGGFAIGLDRYVAVICGFSSVRDVIAFPKTKDGRDLMCNSPTTLSKDELARYHICVSSSAEA